jgi:hypothetical protein
MQTTVTRKRRRRKKKIRNRRRKEGHRCLLVRVEAVPCREVVEQVAQVEDRAATRVVKNQYITYYNTTTRTQRERKTEIM